MTPTRHTANAEGDWYTTGQCLACAAPEDAAPMLFAPLGGDNYLTHFVRQPGTPDEVELACRAALVCCVADVRYGGHDVGIIRRLGNHPEYCDHVIDDEGQLLRAVGRDGEVRSEFRPELTRKGGRNRYCTTVDGRAVTWWLPWVAPDAALD
jgi:hypothetical protein